MRVLPRKVFLKLLVIGGLFISSFGIYRIIHQTRYFPVQYVQVYGANHIDHQELQNLLRPLVTHNFFTVDMELVQDRLRQFSWVEDIAIRRIWPDSVEIVITEHQPIAIWHDGSLLSANGDLFSQGEYDSPFPLPQFMGPDGTQATMLQFFNDFNRELSPLHAKITQLELTPYQMWRLKLDNGIGLRLGHKNILTRISQFVKVYPKIIGDKAKDVEYIDLRYPNGMAVRWKDAKET
jgi:cell division protein FtsQ